VAGEKRRERDAGNKEMEEKMTGMKNGTREWQRRKKNFSSPKAIYVAAVPQLVYARNGPLLFIQAMKTSFCVLRRRK
jgi:hypothetical protein